MAGAKIPLTFRIFKDGTFVREETLTQPVIKVGKLSSSHLRLEDDTVSRMHAVIEVTGPGDVSIIDLGSTKGTFVNGQKVNKAKLQSGDEITLGNTRIEVAIGEGASDAVDAADEEPTRVNTPAAPAGDVISSAPPPVAAAPSAPSVPAPMAAAPAPRPAAPPPMTAAAPPPPGIAPPPGMARSMPAPQFGSDAIGPIDDVSGAPAVEVAAMMGESVVDVKHVMNPLGGKIQPITYGLFVGGALCLLMSIFAFFTAVNNAAYNKVKLEDWTNPRDPHDPSKPHPTREKRSRRSFRPRQISGAYDVMAFGGFIMGIFCFGYGLIRYRRERVSPYYRIGDAPGVEFATNAAGGGAFPLVAPVGSEFYFNFNQQMDGEMMVDGQSVPLSQLQQQGRAQPSQSAPGALAVHLAPKTKFRVRAGGNTFLVSAVTKPKAQPVPLFATVESRALAFVAASAIAHLGFWWILQLVQPTPKAALSSLGMQDARYSPSEQNAAEEDKEDEEDTLEKANDESGGTGTAMMHEEGKMGKKESTRKSGQYAMEKVQETPQVAKQKQLDEARQAGALGVLKAQQGGAFASLTGTGDFSSGLDDQNVYGGLWGDEVGEMQGGYGFGRSGTGPGGGGTGLGTIGTGRYGTIGHGSGTGRGYGVGGGRGSMGGRGSPVPKVRIGQAQATGDLDKAIIRRYIQRNRRKIKNCYDRQLLVNSKLKGTVRASFTIMPAGNVINSSASGVSGAVSSCVAQVIGLIHFPKPKGGGVVNVKYPFRFSSN